ncbi:MAG: hypothetical protein RIC55_29750 [Pirellulaceae bacterium]
MMRIHCSMLLMCVFAGLGGGTACAARYVPIEVRVEGALILKGNASDDGSRDADELWNALKTETLEETPAFTRLTFERKGDLYRITGRTSRSIVVDVAYGGVAKTRRIVLQLMSSDSQGRKWRIAPDDVDALFDERDVEP